RLPRSLPEIRPKDSVRSLAFSPNGKLLAWSHSRGKIVVWNLEANKEAFHIKGNGWLDYLDSCPVAFSPDGQRLAFPALDKSVRIWDVHTGKQIRKLAGPSSPVLSLAFNT